mmetsp:Transcript_42247/g.72142  ORF Transcript_42247/g.72142 Transcript_42247/m.72142 type:complete len:100 (-) Transcript_42247:65-364(-)
MDLLSIRQNQSLPGSDAPYQGDVVLLATARRTGLAGCESVGISEAKTPSDAAFRVCDAFAAGDGGEVNRIEGTVAGAAGGAGAGRHRDDGRGSFRSEVG